MSYTTFRKLIVLGFISVFLVIIAGSVVRMTGSGMGCPDWPKCFGYYIPPTDISQLEWKPDHWFNKGQIIIFDEALWTANSDFKSGSFYQSFNWEKYTKHDYAVFNPYHTWTEYINRLFGALSGLICLVILFASFKLKNSKRYIGLSTLIVLGMGFQAWLGATVVYSVLAPAKITIHMLMALIILIFFILLYEKMPDNSKLELSYTKKAKLWAIGLFTLSIVQVVLGTKVRQETDHLIEQFPALERSEWITNIQDIFNIHGTFAWLIVIFAVGLFYSLYKGKINSKLAKYILVIIGLEFLVGLSFKYLDYPAISQPAHLILASLLFCLSYLVIHRMNARKRV